MNLKSCECCGVVIDIDRLKFPNIENNDGSIDTTKAIWNGDEFIPKVNCPICEYPITKSG